MSVFSFFLFLAYLVLFLISFVFLVVFLPINFSFQSAVDGLFYDIKVDIGFLLGMFNISVRFNHEDRFLIFKLFSFSVYKTRLDGEKTESMIESEEEKLEKAKKLEKPSKRKKRNLTILYKPTKKLFYSIVNIFKIKYLDIKIMAGLSDPYISGIFFGMIYPFVEMLSIIFPVVSLTFTPLFVEDRFKSEIDGQISLRIILLIYPLLKFLFSKEFREYRR